ncbi:serine protease inhibitor Cvsi-2-like [Dreissena polymorpha]|uniref:Uncharacterized protein n=1 Tax=Dreissena polymorpha TaxID=45954 RepID=A0A9D4EUI5_DREPO|nr:serine protease inhibitor Cvsi-2-like [Dreissena polymorpha]KAH3785993.1 hypothetical protein DPMN_164091 [Dreissena polymorpha]
MKFVAIFAAVCYIAMITAEDCPTNNVSTECTHLVCATGFHKECIRNVCTCSTDVECALQRDCHDSGNRTCNREWHCVDGRCRCFGSLG